MTTKERKRARVLMSTGAVGVPLCIGEIAVGTPEQIAALVKSGAGDDNPDAVAQARAEGGKEIDIDVPAPKRPTL